MALQYIPHERVFLRSLPEFSEAWLHQRICDDTSILGLGELDVLDKERVQYAGGRLDLLLSDAENNVRYEVEVTLGATDPGHIIRCIEYWDVERRRYPAYDPVAVLVAEELTTRFLNVVSLLAGSIPIVAIQLNALKVAEQIILDFVKVLDQRALRQDDTVDTGGEDVDRAAWEARVGAPTLAICDQMLAIADQFADGSLELKLKKRHVAVATAGSFFNVLVFYPRKNWVRVGVALPDATTWKERFEDAGLPANTVKGGSRVRFTVRAGDLHEHEALITDCIQQAVEQFQS